MFCVWVQFSFCLKHLSINMDSTDINSIKKHSSARLVLLGKHKVPQHLSKQQQVNLQETAYVGGMLQSVFTISSFSTRLLLLLLVASPSANTCTGLVLGHPTRDPMRTIPVSFRSLFWWTREMSRLFANALLFLDIPAARIFSFYFDDDAKLVYLVVPLRIRALGWAQAVPSGGKDLTCSEFINKFKSD